MAEKVERQPESIPAIVREISIRDKSFYDIVSRHPSMRQLYVRAVELLGTEKLERPVIVDFGGGGGIAEEVIEEHRKGRKFTYINAEYNPTELRKSKGNRLLTNLIDSSLKSNSADAVLFLNPDMPVSQLDDPVIRYVPKNINEEIERDVLRAQFEKIYLYEERAPLCEAARIMKIGGRLVTSNQISDEDKVKFERKEYVDELIAKWKGEFLEREKVQILNLGPEVARLFELRDGQKGYSNFLMEVFVKSSNEGIVEMIDDLKDFKKAADGIINESFQHGILGRMREEGKI
jgi:hypothetical protein